jgi:hypothetical protein
MWGMARIWACADPPRNHLADITHSDSQCTLVSFHKILTKLKYSTIKNQTWTGSRLAGRFRPRGVLRSGPNDTIRS